MPPVKQLTDDDLVFPGLPDRDPLDVAVAEWAVGRPVLAAVRAWSQPGNRAGDDTRTRVYGVLVDTDADVAPAREACAEAVVAAGLADEFAVEAAVLADDLPAHLRRLFDVGVVLWEIPDEASESRDPR
jgi:hypothetical protein